jgi:hypothetical protein
MGVIPAALAEAVQAARFFGALPAVLRHPIRPERARAAVRERMARRGDDFLTLVRRVVFSRPGSPYARLLSLAGCELGDLEALVRRDGLEAALLALFRSGVYLTGDELKGRRPVVRGAASFPVDLPSLRNPLVVPHVVATSSGSRGLGTVVALGLESVQEQAMNACLEVAARGAGSWQHAAWRVPGGAFLTMAIRQAASGAPFRRWFSPVGPGDRLHPRYRWAERSLRWAMRAAGGRMPRPEHVPLDDPLPVVRWMADTLRGGGVPLVNCYASLGARVCRAATEAGVDLRGARFTLGGEPVTEARLAAVARAGAEASSLFGCTEAGGVLAYGCLAPRSAGEMHFLHDLRAVIQPGPGAADAGLPPRALLVTSLRASAPLVLINASVGDEADLGARPCGCPLEAEGWTTHVERLRSFEKLTIGGMSLADADLERLVDEVLPARFGGGPGDWQLVESEDDDGAPRLSVVASPSVGALAPEAVTDALLAWIGRGSGVERIVSVLYRDGGLVHLERHTPFATVGGKVGHLHRRR